MAILTDALRQAFMPHHEYAILRDEDKAWGRLQRPLLSALAALLSAVVLASVSISLTVVFPADPARRPLCRDRRIQALPMNVRLESEGYQYHGAFYLTDDEAADYYWMVVFVPSMVVFFASVIYLVAGMSVAYCAPRRHPCLGIVENNYCASKRGSSKLGLSLSTVQPAASPLLGPDPGGAKSS